VISKVIAGEPTEAALRRLFEEEPDEVRFSRNTLQHIVDRTSPHSRTWESLDRMVSRMKALRAPSVARDLVLRILPPTSPMVEATDILARSLHAVHAAGADESMTAAAATMQWHRMPAETQEHYQEMARVILRKITPLLTGKS
jgi:hypothetical protein